MNNAKISELLADVKQNLICEHENDDVLLRELILAAVDYAEKFQHKEFGFYAENNIPPLTKRAVVMLTSHWYESRDGSTGGFFNDNVQAAQQVQSVVNSLLKLDRDWKV